MGNKVTVFDVAAFILSVKRPITAMKLQKLVYYCQAWSLVWDEQPLFQEKIEAWANGPVVRELYDVHKGMYEISSLPHGNPDNLTASQKETVIAVLDYYGGKSSQWLSDLTHMEDPWKNARAGLPEGSRSQREITPASMEEYYVSLPPSS